jgi:hypothetical protein
MDLFPLLVFAICSILMVAEIWHEKDWPRSTFGWWLLSGIAVFLVPIIFS